MTTAFGLTAKALSIQVPPRVLKWGLVNTLNRSPRTGKRSLKFSRLCLENPDPLEQAFKEIVPARYAHS
jgi:hypothetical protein